MISDAARFGKLSQAVSFGIKVLELVCHSESAWDVARQDLRAQNLFGYFERLNPTADTGIGALRMYNLISF